MNNNSQHPLHNQQGVAIFIVMSAVAVLAFLLADMVYETKLNKIKVYNQQDKLQARLNAEAGLKFAMAKLKIYQAARNIYEKDENIKQFITADQLEQILTGPFAFPIPAAMLAQANVIQRSAINDFSKSIILPGEVSVTMKSVSGLINVNALRVPKPDQEEASIPYQQEEPDDQDNPDQKKKKSLDAFMEDELKKLIENRLNKKREEDENFDTLFEKPDPNLLTKELKYYVNFAEDFDDPEKGEIEALYQKSMAKHAPLVSLSELYLLEGWNDALIDLVKDELTVHAVSVISLNSLTEGQLRFLFPSLTDEQVKEFYKIKNGDEENNTKPQEFKKLEDFKEVMVEKIQAVEGADFDQRIKEFSDADISFGSAGTMFKVVSRGLYERSTYTIEAYVDMPLKPTSTVAKKENTQTPSDDEEVPAPIAPDKTNQDKDKKTKSAIELMEPRIVELQIL